ncbi:MAG: four-carbon acid sugar kinase family protein [Bacteroidetes bacterium]|nr:four-carbon acid sugar kinase family protein [Bacteroidota bacterium]
MLNNKKIKILIIADDLTGCGDVAAWGIKYKLNLMILNSFNDFFDIHNLEYPKLTKDIEKPSFCFTGIIINTHSRLASPAVASKRVKKVIAWAELQDFNFIFKKMDSTLKGNWVIENDIIIRTLKLTNLPIVATYPEYKRFTRKGVHYLYGKKLAHIPTMIRKQSKAPNKMTSYDLVEDVPEGKVYCGTSWFFGEILKKIFLKKKIDLSPSLLKKHKIYQQIIIIAGSRTKVTRKQISQKKLTNVNIIKSPDNFIDNYNLKNLTKQLKNFDLGLENTLLICCGGETSMAVCQELKIKTLKPKEKVAEGIILCRVNEYLDLILKPGSFGNQEFLTQYG